MFGPLLNSTTLPLLEKVAVFGERRQEVLAGNLANIDTPNYKTRDLPVADFQQALRAAVARRHERHWLSHVSPGHVSLGNEMAGNSAPEDDIEDLFPEELFQAGESVAHNITFHDAGNRSVEHEVMEMTKNSMMQQFAVELMVAQMEMLRTVISERP